MKRKSFKQPFWLSIFSTAVVGIFILLAAGSDLSEFPLFEQIKDIVITYDDEKEEYTMQVILSEVVFRQIEYPHPQQGGASMDFGIGIVTNRTGHIEFLTGDTVYYTEIAHWMNGCRCGPATYITPAGVFQRWYRGNEVFLELEMKGTGSDQEDLSAFQLLCDRYPWYLFSMNSFGFEDDYLQAYMDTLESLLKASVFAPEDFDTYYDDVLENLSATPYDSVIQANDANAELEGYFRMKHNELRFAVIDRYRSNGNTTYSIVETTYPGYLLSLYEGDVNGQDFEGFCQDLDSCMTSYGNLDLEDPFFLDSVDARMFRAVLSIMDTEESSSSAVRSLRSTALFSDNEKMSSTPAEVAEVVLFLIVMQFEQGDIMKSAVQQAYWAQNGIDTLATASTSILESHPATSVIVNGYIPRDGGAGVTARGIAWATHYNPTTDDNTEASGSGTGSYDVTITGLTEGETYYARSYATNNVGTAYGNCIRFTATSTIGIEEKETTVHDFNIYPNPASVLTTFTFNSESSEKTILSIIDLNGRMVQQHDLGVSSLGENRFTLDLSELKSGLYFCRISGSGNTPLATRRLIIAR